MASFITNNISLLLFFCFGNLYPLLHDVEQCSPGKFKGMTGIEMCCPFIQSILEPGTQNLQVDLLYSLFDPST